MQQRDEPTLQGMPETSRDQDDQWEQAVEERKQVISLQDSGLSYAEIGRRLGISAGRARRIFKEKPKPRKPVVGYRLMHPLFLQYRRDWLHELTGYSTGYLSRLATGNRPLSLAFIERVCYRLNKPREELFLPDTPPVGDSVLG